MTSIGTDDRVVDRGSARVRTTTTVSTASSWRRKSVRVGPPVVSSTARRVRGVNPGTSALVVYRPGAKAPIS